MSYYSSYIHSYSHFSYPIIFFHDYFLKLRTLYYNIQFVASEKVRLNSYFPTYMSHHFSEFLFLDL